MIGREFELDGVFIVVVVMSLGVYRVAGTRMSWLGRGVLLSGGKGNFAHAEFPALAF